jgi:hypothetical protein
VEAETDPEEPKNPEEVLVVVKKPVKRGMSNKISVYIYI